MKPHLLVYKGTQTISLQIGVRQVLLTPGKHDLDAAYVPKYLAHPRIQKMIESGELEIIPPKGAEVSEPKVAEEVAESHDDQTPEPAVEEKSEEPSAEEKPGILGKMLGKKSGKKKS